MLCPICKLEMVIIRSQYKVKNDDTADKETKLFLEQTLSCRNKACQNFGKDVEIIDNPLKLE